MEAILILNENVHIKKENIRLKVALLIISLLTLLTGCQSAPQLPDPRPPRMILSIGDEVEVKFAYAEQFNELQAIRPDGKISLQFVGEVTAQGKTPAELHEELMKLYAAHLKHPQLTVIVRTLQERHIYVGGQVNAPGLYQMLHGLSVFEAIMQAGGFNEPTADLENVIVVRQSDGKRCSYSLNLKKSIEGKGKQVKAFYLEPRDIVLVPQTTIVNIDIWVKQYIKDILPITPSAGTFIAPQAAQ